MSDRNLVAARVVARDHGSLLIDGDFSVRLEARVVEAILRISDRTRYDGFHPTRYDASPLELHTMPKWRLHRLRSRTSNKRLLALIGLAVETGTRMSFVLPEDRLGKGVVKVAIDVGTLAEWNVEALNHAERYLRIELAEASRSLVSRTGPALSLLDIDPVQVFSPGDLPDMPQDRVVAYLSAASRFGRWLKLMIASDEPATKDVVDRLEERARRRRGSDDALGDLLLEAAAEIRRLRG